MAKKLEGKIAVITGATSGMALATAKLFVEEGAYVFITGRRQEQLDAALKEIGMNATGVQGDAGNLADLDRLYERVRAQKGHIDVLYASAGFGEFNIPLGAITEANFNDTFNLNVRGTLFTVQKALPLIRDGGSIIMTGSIAGVKGFRGLSVYSASKAAIRSFARTWAVDLKDRHIRVNVISPGTIDTGIFVGVPTEVKDQFVSIIPMGRIGQPHGDRHGGTFSCVRRFQFRHWNRVVCRWRHCANIGETANCPGCDASRFCQQRRSKKSLQAARKLPGAEHQTFTVIGPAVNEASRIAAMCRSVEQPMLVSAAFAGGRK
jgi:NAD(P)-dependent dehydrogenase (short-subunit alcohol dehydrogenase family)